MTFSCFSGGITGGLKVPMTFGMLFFTIVLKVINRDLRLNLDPSFLTNLIFLCGGPPCLIKSALKCLLGAFDAHAESRLTFYSS